MGNRFETRRPQQTAADPEPHPRLCWGPSGASYEPTVTPYRSTEYSCETLGPRPSTLVPRATVDMSSQLLYCVRSTESSVQSRAQTRVRSMGKRNMTRRGAVLPKATRKSVFSRQRLARCGDGLQYLLCTSRGADA